MSLEQFKTPYDRLLALWILRIFSPRLVKRVFIQDSDYKDPDIAEFLGLPPLPDEETLKAVPGIMAGMLAELEESGDAALPRNVAESIQEFTDILGFDATERSIFTFFACGQLEHCLHDSMKVVEVFLAFRQSGFLAKVIGLRIEDVETAMQDESALMRSGMLRWTSSTSSRPSMVFYSTGLAHQLIREGFDHAKILAEMGIALSPVPLLGLEDFPHLETELQLLIGYLRNAAKTNRPGVNILIYGEPGTGKTQLTRVIGQAVGAPLFDFLTVDRVGSPSDPKERICQIRSGQALFRDSHALFVFDEAEDILTPSSKGRGIANERKGWFNQLLESNFQPVFWLSNSIDFLDPAFARRFDFALEVSIPPRSQRERILRQQVGDQVSPATIERLSQLEELAPAVVTRARDVMVALGNDLPSDQRDDAFIRIIGGVLKAQGHPDPGKSMPHILPPDVYDVTYLNTSADLRKIAKMLKQNPNARICLHGPPGTGKTAFGHWLAKQIDRPIQIKRASDLLSPFVGGTEQKIAGVFEQALRDDAVLMIDEMDSFLQDRSMATRSWEVTQVNEMLTRMEVFEGVLIASTNRMEHLDAASLRRFDLKLRFGYLKPRQISELLGAWCRSLGIPSLPGEHPATMETLETVTPGDFAAIARRHRFHPFADSGELLLALMDECATKTESARRIGFQ